MLKTPNNQDSFRPNHKSNQAQPERTGLFPSQVDTCMAASHIGQSKEQFIGHLPCAFLTGGRVYGCQPPP
eukprot:533633-Pelagomonas_calceolata.AAC.2